MDFIPSTISHKDIVKYGVGLAAGTGALIWTHNSVKNWKERRHLQMLVSERQAKRAKDFAVLKLQYQMTDEYKEILGCNLEQLREQLASRKLTATKVLSAYIAKALEANEETNCVTEFNPRAMEMALELDARSTVKGHLHGIPFCVKDDTGVAGMDSTVGFATNLNKPYKVNATIVQVLEDLGGIPFCRTNLPQSCISFGSHNPIFGWTTNPLNTKLSPGGSSSGTGALIAAGGAPFGIGTDTGGSARVPAHLCGLSSLKSSKNRVSRRDCLFCIEKCVGLVTTPCIIAKHAEEVAAVFGAMMKSNLHNIYDPKAVPLGWDVNKFESNHKLRIGYYTSLDVFPSMGDTADTVLTAKTALESLGHSLIPFELPESELYIRVIKELSGANLWTHLAEKLKNDQVSPLIRPLYEVGCLPMWKRKLCSILPSCMNYYDPQMLKTGLKVKDSARLWDCMGERHLIIKKLLDRIKEQELDLILCPAWPFPALPLEDINNDAMTAGIYTFIWNLVDFPAGIVKVGQESGKHFNDYYDDKGDAMKKLAKNSIRQSTGMPIGVQIVGKPFQEELVLRAMVELEKQIRG